MQLELALYEAVVQDLADYNPKSMSGSGDDSPSRTRSQAHALVLTYMSTNTSYIAHPQPLWENKLLKRGDESCGSSKHLYTGTICRRQVIKFRSTYQFLASAGILVWGLMLFLAALPYRGMVIRGNLDQWMSFGADVGLEDMVGASSGRTSAVSDRIWGLRVSAVGDAEHTVGLEPYDEKMSSEPLKLRFGERYI